MKLRGGAYQTAGGVWVVDSPGEVDRLLGVLYSTPHPVGLDLEYTYVPKRHNLDFAHATCMTLAYVDESLGRHRVGCYLAQRVFIPAFDDDGLIQQLRCWLEDPTRGKVGHNIISADAHVLANHGISLRGIVGDTLRMSRMAYNSKDIRHGLKPNLQRELGYHVVDLDAVLQRPKRLKPKVYKRTQIRNPGKTAVVQVPTLYCEGPVSVISHKEHESIPQHEYWENYPREPFIDYASLDAKGTLELWFVLRDRLARLPARVGNNWDLYNSFWQPYCKLVAKTERNGVALDIASCEAGEARATLDIEAIDAELAEYAPAPDFNWNAPAQLKELIYTRWGMPRAPIKGTMRAIKPTAIGEFSAAEASLHWLQLQAVGTDHHHVLDLIRRRKKAERLRGYLRSLPGFVHPDGRLHPQVAPSTDTGRLAASIPPLQQIPNPKGDKYGIRRAFVAREGHVLVVADYSQLEVYVLAHFLEKLFGDSSISGALATGDVYGAIAKECWPDALAGIEAHDIKHHPDKSVQAHRDKAKVVVLATNYCMSVQGMAISLLDESGESVGLEAASELLMSYDARYPGVSEFQRFMGRMAARYGGVSDLLGFWRPLPEAKSERAGERASGFRKAANTPIQGSASKVVAQAMLGLDRNAPWAMQVLQVHDEIITEVPADRAEEAARAVESAMVGAGEELGLMVKLKADVAVAGCWADGK